jgi:hypothetical protein
MRLWSPVIFRKKMIEEETDAVRREIDNLKSKIGN